MIGLTLSERNKQRATHNHSRINGGRPSKTFTAWINMIQRCTNEKHRSFPRYGGRGVTICDEWKRSFESFLADMGEVKDGYSLDRIDVNGNYEPSNCRWVTMKAQGNNRGNNRLIEFDGRVQTLTQWAEEVGISKAALGYRIRSGWNVEEALTMKLDHGSGWKRGSR